jgi:hypothetical protein
MVEMNDPVRRFNRFDEFSILLNKEISIMKKYLLSILFTAIAMPLSMAGGTNEAEPKVVSFGEGGIVKMIYDARQRPQAVYLNDKLHIVFNGEGRLKENKNSKRKAEARPMAVTYDPDSGEFSETVALSETFSADHHDGPVIWADLEEKLHVFYGWHHDLGTHLVSDKAGSIGSSRDDWSESTAPSPKMSYQWMSRIYDDKQLVFFRTDGHYSSWTYRITSDNGKTWERPEHDVLDLDLHLGKDTDWSTYTAKEVSKDGNYLHLGFVAYDDYKRPVSPQEIASGELEIRRMQNPLYGNRVPSNYKYNLYYVKIDLRTHEAVNDKGEVLQTPIDRETANSQCMIWDTEWRGGGIIPTIRVDEDDQVSFLHNISDVKHEKSLSYHYVRRVNEKWKRTRITNSNHHWNSGHITETDDGVLHAYLLKGEGYLNVTGDMDRYGGGAIEEWTSTDMGNTWKKERRLFQDVNQYSGWKYNNIQSVERPDGSIVDGMLLFYGWKDGNAPEAKAFLLHDE